MKDSEDSTTQAPRASLPLIAARAVAAGLAVRGAFHPRPGEFARELPGVEAGTLVLLGFTGRDQWPLFEGSPEAHDGAPDPLDRWSRRTIGGLAREFSAHDVYPSGAGPLLPFQQLALRAEPVHRSPIGLLIHPVWGLWHAYRGALVLAGRLALPPVTPTAHPCDACTDRPCLRGCPVGAFKPGAYDVAACASHLRGAAGAHCLDGGCAARRACPVGAAHRYSEAQTRFHMRAFHAALTR